MSHQQLTKPDWGLRLRMVVTMALLAAVYLAFLSFLKEIFSTHPSLERGLEQLEQISRELGTTAQ